MKNILSSLLQTGKAHRLYLLILGLGLVVAFQLNRCNCTTPLGDFQRIVAILCVGVSLISFLAVLNANQLNIPRINWIGFGLLASMIFNAFFLRFHPSDVSILFTSVARLTEVMVLLSIVFWIGNLSLTNLQTISFTVALTLGISILLIYQQSLLNDSLLHTNLMLVVTSVRSVTLLVAFISLVALYQPQRKNIIFSYRDIRMSLLLLIPQEISYLLSDLISTVLAVYGDVLTVCFYFYLYRVIFISLVRYPYQVLSEQKALLSVTAEQMNALSQVIRNAKMTDQNKHLYIRQLSHELKNPLNVLYCGVQLIRAYSSHEDIESPKLQGHLEAMEKNCNQLVELIDSMVSNLTAEADDGTPL